MVINGSSELTAG